MIIFEKYFRNFGFGFRVHVTLWYLEFYDVSFLLQTALEREREREDKWSSASSADCLQKQSCCLTTQHTKSWRRTMPLMLTSIVSWTLPYLIWLSRLFFWLFVLLYPPLYLFQGYSHSCTFYIINSLQCAPSHGIYSKKKELIFC